MTSISLQTLKRLPIYLGLLKEKKKDGVINTSSSAIAEELGLVDIQVRKDLATVSSGGRPKVGYIIDELITDIEASLGYDNTKDAVLVGAGNLGRALLSYKGFSEYGMNIVAAFDNNKALAGSEINGKKIHDISEFSSLCERMHVHIGIITVPADYAQEVCNLMIESGIIAIWNFAPTHLKTDNKDILIHNENMAASLAMLSKHLSESHKVY